MPHRRTAVALLAAGTLALAGCGSDDDSTTSTSTASTATSTSTAAPTTSTSDTSATTDGDATAVAGTGYTFSVPEGWTDAKAQAASAAGAGASQLDRAYASPDADGDFRTNVTTTRAEIPGSVDAAQAVKLTTDNARKQFSQTGTVSPNEQTTLGGEPATSYVISRTLGGVDVRQRQFAAVRDGAVYSLTVSYAASESDDGEEIADEAQRTWSWR